MADSKTVRLPKTEFSAEHYFWMGFNYCGDILLRVGAEDLADVPYSSETIKAYQLTHSAHSLLFASLVGYSTRAELTEGEMRTAFANACSLAATIDPDEYIPSISRSKQYTNIEAATGNSKKRYDRQDLGWNCLMQPVPPVPGTDLRGGTGLFTKTNDNGRMVLVVAKTFGLFADPEYTKQEAESATFLLPEDIPPIAEVICELSRGDYREEITKLLAARFPVK